MPISLSSPVKSQPTVVLPCHKNHDFYVGIKIGAERFNGTRNSVFTLADTQNSVAPASSTLKYATKSLPIGKRTNVNSGVCLGYDYRFTNGFFLGAVLEADYNFFSEKGQNTWKYFQIAAVGGLAPARTTIPSVEQKRTWSLGLLGKLGFSFGKASVYGLVGPSLSRFETTVNIQDKYGANPANNSSYKFNAASFGVTVGLGMQYKFTPCFSLALEGRWKKMKDKNYEQSKPSDQTSNQAVTAFRRLPGVINQLGTKQESVLGNTPQYGLEIALKASYHF